MGDFGRGDCARVASANCHGEKSERCDNEGGAPENRIVCIEQVLTPRDKALNPVHGPVVTARFPSY